MRTITKQELEELMQPGVKLSSPHVLAMLESFKAAAPDKNPYQMYAFALAYRLASLLHELEGDSRLKAVDIVNVFMNQPATGW